uniref:CSON009528 protein n=1 Tax=Culicoides sonorensis TaxID=179676 RepID=A0A336LNY7_CULSO
MSYIANDSFLENGDFEDQFSSITNATSIINAEIYFNNLSFNANYNHNNSTIISIKPVVIEWNSIKWLLTMYSIIFMLATIGNSLVILTLVQNKRMRTITNVYLLNLAISDLFLGVFCMPFTLVGMILRNFIFGEIMCKLLPYLQASSVAVSSWTLVAISVERYYAICHPLSSRRWQTLSHAYKLIVIIWLGSLFFMFPIAYLSKLIPTRDGHHKCRENWPDNSEKYERTFNLFLDVILLVLPLLMLGATYSLITKTLWQDMRTENYSSYRSGSNATNIVEVYINSHGTPSSRCPSNTNNSSCPSENKNLGDNRNSGSWKNHGIRSTWSSSAVSQEPTPTSQMKITSSSKRRNPALRRSNAEKSLQNKKRVIKMLLLVVLEFFICWTPLYIINTIALFDPIIIYQDLGYHAVSVFQLLAYSSSCCNPITYCFMNSGFRKAFLNLFKCFKRFHIASTRNRQRRTSMGGYVNNNASNNAPQQSINIHIDGNNSSRAIMECDFNSRQRITKELN